MLRACDARLRRPRRAGTPALPAGLILATAPALPPPAADAAAAPRVVAIGDIHGSLESFVAILRAAGLIDGANRWVGGRAVLVQTGDSSDRGDDMRGVMDLLMALEAEAPRNGGRVITLLGNHEAMVLIGDFTAVTPGICARFADARSDDRRERAWRERAAGRPPLPARHRHARARLPRPPLGSRAHGRRGFTAIYLDERVPLGAVAPGR